MNFKDVALNIAKAISKANHYKDGSINSYEVFVNKNYKRIINSNGIDLNEVSGDIFVEAIPNWVGKDEEVELYTDYVTSSINYDEITYKIDEALNNCQLRSVARKLPEGLKKCNVILPQEEISGILEFLARQTSYQNVFMKTNILNVNDNVSGDNPDKLNITLKPEIEGGAYKTLFDDDGLILKDFNFIEDGIIKSYHGDNRFGYYLGIDNPTGMYKNAELKPGTMSFDEMKSEPYIYCMYFSSPQLDDYSGYYGGEVRLGLYFDGKECYPVTGFSISGNLNNDFKIFKFSKEVDTYKNYRGPKYLLIKDMNIN
jgi:predicted Zn-dependent protease